MNYNPIDCISEMIDYYNDITYEYQVEQQFPELVNDFDDIWSDFD